MINFKILKQGILNFLSNLKFFFIPLGTLFLGIILGISIAFPLILNTLNDVVYNFSNLSLELDFNAFIDTLGLAIGELDWKNSITAISTLFSKDWLEVTLNNSIRQLVINYDAHLAEIEIIVTNSINDIVIYLIVFLIMVAIGFVGGYFLTKYLIRQEVAKRSIVQFLVVTLIDGIISATLVSLCMYLLSLWQVSALFSTLFSYILFATISLFEAYLIHANKKIDIKKVVNFQNSSNLIISDLIVIICAWLLSSTVAILFNELAGGVIGFTLMEIAFIVIGLNAESYVLKLVENNEKCINKLATKNKK